MASCNRCGKNFTGDELYCPPCEEFTDQQTREEYGIFCSHCKKIMLAGEFEKHRFRVFYQTRDFPRGRRVRL
jgi:hypothetical protein